ncbi:MAG: CubicO group peptidase (beta-lactamase class C family) [Candidatus Azotimanducaceae bacterium]|jgi:CubicO group peptidase (beta-lactamase class C family)
MLVGIFCVLPTLKSSLGGYRTKISITRSFCMLENSSHQFTADDWGYPPQNRHSFQQVQSLFATARLRRGQGPVTEFSRDSSDIMAISYEGLGGAERTVRQMLEDGYTDAFMVLKDNNILHEQYFNGMAADSFHLLNSVSKSFVGMLAGIQIARSLVKETDLVTQYIPELAQTAFSASTIRHLLDMTAAPKYGENYADPNADFWVEASVVGWRPALRTKNSATTLLDYAKTLIESEQRNGEKYHYRTVLTNVLGMVLERAGTGNLQDQLQNDIWAKLSPEQDAAIVVDSAGFPYVGAGMNTCTRDLARFGQMIMQQGEYNGAQVVPKDWIDDTRYADDQARANFAASDYGAMMPGGHYRNQVWVENAEHGILAAIGIHGQIIHINMRTRVVIVKFSTHPKSADGPLFQDGLMAMTALSNSV